MVKVVCMTGSQQALSRDIDKDIKIMTNENMIIDCNELKELQREFPQEMEVIIKMLTEVGEGCHSEMSSIEA